MMFLLGRHAIFGHDPPMYLRSIAATRFSSPAKVHAAIVDPVPPPRISRSKSSIFDSFDTCTDELFFVLFIPISSLVDNDAANLACSDTGAHDSIQSYLGCLRDGRRLICNDLLNRSLSTS